MSLTLGAERDQAVPSLWWLIIGQRNFKLKIK